MYTLGLIVTDVVVVRSRCVPPGQYTLPEAMVDVGNGATRKNRWSLGTAM